MHIHIYEIGFPGVSDGKSICLQCRKPEFDPGLGRSPGEGESYFKILI